jgi:hypothetical protein
VNTTLTTALRAGPGVLGVPFVKFALTYDGSLPPSANKAKRNEVWEIRQKFDPQLVDLWKHHPALIEIEQNGRYFPKRRGAGLTQFHHNHPGRNIIMEERKLIAQLQEQGDQDALDLHEPILDLCEPIEKHGAWFRPLVRESFAVHCGLKILFLRKEPPGRVYQGGDLDGRIKTLIDSLVMPQHAEQVLERTSTKTCPIYCVLQDDCLVSGVNVETERLLTDQNYSKDYVRLVIEVDVRVRQAMIYNQSFLG